MSFRWNTYGWINLGIDLATVAALLITLLYDPTFRNGSVTTWRFLRRLGMGAMAALGLGFLGAISLGGILGLSVLTRVCWTFATVGLPLALLARWRTHRHIWLLLLALGLVGFKYYGEIWETDRLEIDRRQIPVPGLSSPLRIVHLSDLQTDDLRGMHHRLQKAANDFDPDLMVFTGDLMNHYDLANEIADFLSGFHTRHGAYFVGGDVDRGLNLQSFCDLAHMNFLDRRTDVLSINNQHIALMGLGLVDFYDEELLKDLVEKSGNVNLRILLAHRPDALFLAENLPIDVFFTGHTHGGQICAPWGPLLTLTGVDRSIAAGGVHQVKNLWVVLSRGLGGEGHFAPRIRIFCRPHLLLVELVPQK